MQRINDTMEEKCYDHERRIAGVERDITNMCSTLNSLKIAIREEQTELKDAIKDLAISQSAQALSMAKIESSLTTLSKGLGIGLPLVFSIIGAIWTYSGIFK